MTEDKQFELWKQKLRKELKADDLGTRTKMLSNGIAYDPFIDPGKVIALPFKIERKQELSIGFSSNHLSEKEQNILIRELLPFELKVLKLNATALTDWNILLHGVYPSMIHMEIAFADAQSVEKFISWRSVHNDRELWQISANMHLPKGTHDKIYTYLDYTNESVNDQIEVLRSITRELKTNDYPFLKIGLNITENLLESLPFVRAVHYLMHQHGSQDDYLIGAIVQLPVHKSSEETDLILASTAAVWAAISSVDHLYFNAISPHDVSEQMRLILNIQNLINLESNMNVNEDVLGGSYIIEDLCQKLIRAI